MALDPKPITLDQVDTGDFNGAFDPQPFVVVGDIPIDSVGVDVIEASLENANGYVLESTQTLTHDGANLFWGTSLEPQAAPAIDATPADANAVAADLQAVVTALIDAGVLTS